MTVKTKINYRNAFAHYNITIEDEGIYSATLLDYEGSIHDLPPANIILTKGIRHWIGSTSDEVLTNDLGEVIDVYLQSGKIKIK
jgi:hypothetical protein